MECQSCQSKHAVKVKDQAFCLKCGQKLGRKTVAKTVQVHYQAVTVPKPKLKPVSLKLGDIVRRAARITLTRSVSQGHITANLVLAFVVLLPILSWPFLGGSLADFVGQPLGRSILAGWLLLAVTVLALRAYLAHSAIIGAGRYLDNRPVTHYHRFRLSRRLMPRLLALKLIELVGLSAVAILGGLAIKQAWGLPILGLGGFGWVGIISATVAGASILAITAISVAAVLTDNRKVKHGLNYALKLDPANSQRALVAVTITLVALALPLGAIFLVFAMARWNDSVLQLLTSGAPFFLALGISLVVVGTLLHLALMFSQILWLLIYRQLSRA